VFVQALVSGALMFLAVRQVLNSLAVRQPRGILGRYLKGDLETKKSICACVVLSMGAKLLFNSRKVRFDKTLCFAVGIITLTAK